MDKFGQNDIFHLFGWINLDESGMGVCGSPEFVFHEIIDKEKYVFRD